MKLLFSEAKPNHADYVYPYAVWAFPEPDETAADLFAAGFLPSNHQLERFYLCRHLRVDLRRYRASSENRRVLRKGAGVEVTLIPREEFALTSARRDFCLRYTAVKIPSMTAWRLDSLFSSKVTTHVLLVREATGREIGYATIFLTPGRMAFYYYALDAQVPSLGMFMMTSAVQLCADRGEEHIYLGTCYSLSALYKTQFAGVEFFNGRRWSGSMEELKHLLRRQEDHDARGHVLESAEYREEYLCEGLGEASLASRFSGTCIDHRPEKKAPEGA